MQVIGCRSFSETTGGYLLFAIDSEERQVQGVRCLPSIQPMYLFARSYLAVKP